MKTRTLPSFIIPLSQLFTTTLLILLAARIAMLGLLWKTINTNALHDILNALYIGSKFDIRMTVLYLIPITLVLGIPQLERQLRHNAVRVALVALYSLVFCGAAFIYVIDFGWFFYMNQRVDATLFDFAGDTAI